MYERATALLGYTSTSLIDEVVTAVAERDAAGAFAAVDRIVQTGQDPRRFVEDLLERLRDLIVVAATGEGAAAVLRGTPADQIAALIVQAQRFGTAELSRAADTVSDALDEMVGATSPRLHLELMIARMLVPAAAASDGGAIARLERLERRVGVELGEGSAPRTGPVPVRPAAEVRPPQPSVAPPAPAVRPAAQTVAPPAPSVSAPSVQAPAAAGPGCFGTGGRRSRRSRHPTVAAPSVSAPTVAGSGAPEAAPDEVAAPATAPVAGAVTLQHVRDAWTEILETVQRTKRSAWAVVYTSHPRALDGDVLTLSFVSRSDVETFRQAAPSGGGTSEVLRAAILSVLGIRVKFLPEGRRRPGGPRGRGARRMGSRRRPDRCRSVGVGPVPLDRHARPGGAALRRGGGPRDPRRELPRGDRRGTE